MTTINKMQKARAGLILDQPFFGSLALRLQLREDSDCETAWTDGESLGFNPTFVDALSLDETKGFLAHEVLHLVFGHQARRGERDESKWNQAGDYAINPVLVDSKFTLPLGALIDSTYREKSADEIYNLLPTPEQKAGQEDPGGCGAVRDSKGQDGRKASPAQRDLEIQNWKIATTQAAQQAKAMGQLPASLLRLVEDFINPKVSWQEVLRHFMERSARNDYSWVQPNRRYVMQGIYLPSLKSEELGPLVVAVDTSGSIQNDALKQFAAELTDILENYDTTCTVIYCDALVAGIETFGREDLPLTLQAKGGGGTDFRPVFTYVKEADLAPACLIYLTDLDCSRYPEEVDYPVLWGHIGMVGTTPPFGEVIDIK